MKRANVVPIALRRFHQDEMNSDYLHKIYFEYKNQKLSKFFKHSNKKKSYKKYYGLKKYKSWFYEDVLLESIRIVKKNYNFVKKEEGKNFLIQLIEVIFISCYLPSMPENYYKFEWYKKNNRKKIKEYIHRYEIKNVLYKLLVKDEIQKNLVSLNNKKVFFDFVNSLGLPVAETRSRILKFAI